MFTKPVFINKSNKFGNNRWIVYSNKINRIVYLFSDLEYANWLVVENDPSIKYFCEQPIIIEAVSEGKVKSSIPDMYIQYVNGVEAMREIKYTVDINSERAKQQSFIQKSWCNKNNYKYELVTDEHLTTNSVYLSNLKQLSKIEIDITQVNRFKGTLDKFINSKPNTVLELSKIMNIEIDDILQQIFCLIKVNYINSNINELFLGPLTEVWRDEAQIS